MLRQLWHAYAGSTQAIRCAQRAAAGGSLPLGAPTCLAGTAWPPAALVERGWEAEPGARLPGCRLMQPARPPAHLPLLRLSRALTHALTLTHSLTAPNPACRAERAAAMAAVHQAAAAAHVTPDTLPADTLG